MAPCRIPDFPQGGYLWVGEGGYPQVGKARDQSPWTPQKGLKKGVFRVGRVGENNPNRLGPGYPLFGSHFGTPKSDVYYGNAGLFCRSTHRTLSSLPLYHSSANLGRLDANVLFTLWAL